MSDLYRPIRITANRKFCKYFSVYIFPRLRNPRFESTMNPETSKQASNWAELPRDIMILIFTKLGAFHILFSAQMVCSSWWELSKDPQFFHSIDIRDNHLWAYWGSSIQETIIQKIAFQAVDRSCGNLVEFSIQYFGTNAVLHHIASKTSLLKRLRFVMCYELADGLVALAKRCPLLEELDLCFSLYTKDAIEDVGRYCLELKSVRLDCRGFELPYYSPVDKREWDEVAVLVAKGMPQLRRLCIFRNALTDDGLRAILDGCPHLEYLDIRQCFHVVDSHLLRMCAGRIQNLRLVDDALDDLDIGGKRFFYPLCYGDW